MAKTKISEFSSTPANNTDIDSINIAEGCAPSNINDAIRELMAQLKDFQIGSQGDSFNGPIGTSTAAAGAFTTLTASSTLGVTGVSTLTGGAVVQGLTVGRGAGAVSTNTAVGASALAANTSGSENNAFGFQALQSETTGVNNDAFGVQSQRYTTTGQANVSMGRNSLYGNTTGSYNTALGSFALLSNTTASNNTAVGYQAGYSNTTGTALTAFGANALRSSVSVNNNVAFGDSAGYAATGAKGTFVGSGSGSEITSGAANTILGRYNGNQGGLDIRTASNYIVLSDGDGNPRGWWDSSGRLILGTAPATLGIICSKFDGGSFVGISLQKSNTNNMGAMRYYNSSGTEVGSIVCTESGTTYATSSDYRLKNTIEPMTGALAKVAQLKPVTYKWNVDGSNGQGFIAHELQEVVPECVLGEKDAMDANGNPKYQGIDTSFLVATLTAAIQELKAEFDAYKAGHP